MLYNTYGTSTTKARSCRKEEQGRMLVEAKISWCNSTYDKYDLYDFHQEIVKNPTVCTTSTIKARSDRKEEQGRIARATSATYLVSPGNHKEPDCMYNKYDLSKELQEGGAK